jgi:hypothetical protein
MKFSHSQRPTRDNLLGQMRLGKASVAELMHGPQFQSHPAFGIFAANYGWRAVLHAPPQEECRGAPHE